MCGFAGYLCAPNQGIGDVSRVVAMTDRIAHRGPDDADVWLDARAGIAIGFRRLSILDLSHAGRQPMRSASGRYVIAFNGEIYNHRRLRAELHGTVDSWRGASDTETLLACIDCWGVERTLRRAVGMFAFALWDRDQGVLTLTRDRMGEKPCYYGWQGSTFLFASELKALRLHPAFRGEIDEDVVALYLRLGYVPTPHSIFRGIHKLQPGTVLRVSASARATPADSVPYWSLSEVAAAGASAPFDGTEDEAIDELERLLEAAIADQRLADVPVGAFLSGGVDSSTIVALLQRRSTRPVRTFTVGFDDTAADESSFASAVARHLGTDHVEVQVTSDDAMQVAPQLATLYDEPFADASAIPTFLVAQLARRDVTVALSGDGGDELFGGYERYSRALRIHDAVRRVPRWLRRVSAEALRVLPSRAVGEALTGLAIGEHPYMFSSRVDTVRRALAADAFEPLYLTQVSLWRDPASVMTQPPKALDSVLDEPGFGLPRASALDRMLHADSRTYLPDDILVKVDRAAMAVSLETRIPLLDHRVVEFAWSLPSHLKRRAGIGKWVLRRVLARHVPDGLVDRPKQGFAAPTGIWVRRGLREWAETALSEAALHDVGLLRADVVRRLWAQHLDGRHDWQNRLWPVIVLQHWLRAQRSYGP